MSKLLIEMKLGIIVFVMLCTMFIGSSLASTEVGGGSINIVVDNASQPSIAEGLVSRVQTSWPWYLTRASGLVAGVVLIILMLSGVGFITGHTFAFLEPITAWATHRVLGIVFGVSVLLHVGALYFDSFVPFGIKDLLIPFASDYKPIMILGTSVGSLYVALGVLALYITGAIVVTSLLWIDKKPKTWKITHILSYIVMVFVFVHALYLGTDLASGTFRWLWVGLGLVVLYASLMRLWRAKTV